MADESLDSKVETVDESKRDFLRLGLLGAVGLATGCYHRPGKRKLWSGLIDGKLVEYFSNDPSFGRKSYWTKEDNVLIVYKDEDGREVDTEFHDADGSGKIGDHKKDKVVVYRKTDNCNFGLLDIPRFRQDVYSRDRFEDFEGKVFTRGQGNPVNQEMMKKVDNRLKEFSEVYQKYMKLILEEVKMQPNTAPTSGR